MGQGSRVALLVGAVLLGGILFVCGALLALAGVSLPGAAAGATSVVTEPAAAVTTPVPPTRTAVATVFPVAASPLPGPAAAASQPAPTRTPAASPIAGPAAAQASSGTPARPMPPAPTPPTSPPVTSPPVAGVASPAPQGSPPAQATQREIRVYFSRRPESDADMAAVFPVTRVSDDTGVARAAVLAMLAGPTPQEAAAGYFSELGGMRVGPSNCGGEAFTIRIDQGIATLRFCHLMQSAGIGQDARVTSSLNATLRQFSTVQRVRVLSRDGDCFLDMSGENRCLRDG